MADTVDVAHVLFDVITGYEFDQRMYMDDVNPVEVLYWLEHISTTFRIGIEDARAMRYRKTHETPRTTAEMRRDLYLPEN